MGSGSRNGSVAAADRGGEGGCGGVAFGLKMKTFSESVSHHHPYHRPPPLDGGFTDSCGGGGGARLACMSEAYDVVGAVGGSTLVPFNTDSSDGFKSSGVGAAASRSGLAFTASQLQELQRQALVYKYMISNVPVPPQLLLPISTSLSQSTLGKGSVELRFSNNSDPEPWRCRRTDGKKWRCSRDVAPDQKYCERHTHKGKPRSRKPVELHPENAVAVACSSGGHRSVALTLPPSSTVLSTNRSYQQPSFLEHSNDNVSVFSTMVSAAPYELPRCSEWFDKEESMPVAKSYTDMSDGQVFHFIDAWTRAEGEQNKCSVSSNGKLPFSSLTLSMSHGNYSSQGNQEDDLMMGFENGGCVKSQQPLNWMSPGPWMDSQPGGPLAEALCLGIATTTKTSSLAADAASPHDCSTGTATTSTSSCGDADKVQFYPP